MSISEIWSRLTPGGLTAADLAAEGAVLGDAAGHVLALSGRGDTRYELELPAPVHDLSAGDDGSVAVVCGAGEVVLLSAGRITFRRAPGPEIRFVRAGPHGDYFLALSAGGEGVFLNRFGREMGRIAVPGGVTGVTLSPRSGQVVTVSGDGTVRCFTSWGKARWDTRLASTPGAPACDARGALILVPLSTWGVDAFTGEGASIGAFDVGEPVAVAACSGDGETLLLGTTKSRLVELRRDATVVTSERFPAPITGLRVAADGEHALVRTGSGYAHYLALGSGPAGRRLEFSPGRATPRTPYVGRERVFSPHSLVLRSRLSIAPDGRLVAVAGERNRVVVLEPSGRRIDQRRYPDSLLALAVRPDGAIRVMTTRRVFRFVPREPQVLTEWSGELELTAVALTPSGSAVGVTEGGAVLAFAPGPGPAEEIFRLGATGITDVAASPRGFAFVHADRTVEFRARDGGPLGALAAFPAPPSLLASGAGGYLVAAGRTVTIVGPDGGERARHVLPARAARAVLAEESFVVADDRGQAWRLTPSGHVRPAFRTGAGGLCALPDAQGFVAIDGATISVLAADGSPRWRFLAPDEILGVAVSSDGRLVAALAVTELFVFPVDPAARPPAAPDEPAAFLEFADG